MLERFLAGRIEFNDEQVDLRSGWSMEQVLEEYRAAHQQVLAASAQIAPEAWHQAGILPWYGEEYDLEDFIIYTYYGHKREHCGQIAVFRDRFIPPPAG
jgi:hypothetical protein